MWILFLILPSFVLIGSAIIAIICNERRPLVLLCLGGMVGMVATSIALSLLGLLAGIGIATWVVLTLLLLGGLAAAVYWWRAQLWQGGLDVSRKYVFLLLVLAGHFGVVAAVSWQFAVGAGVELDSLFTHSAFSSTISRGNFPVANPYQPENLLTYRLTYHVLGAFTARLAGVPAPEALTVLTGALYTLLFLGAVGVGLASRFGPGQTLLAAALFFVLGDFRWLQLAQLASLEHSDFNHYTLVTSYLQDSVGPALTKGLENVSLTYGHLVVFCGLALYIYGWQAEGWRRSALPLATGVVLGLLAAASETWFAALAVALLVDLARRLIAYRKVCYRSILRVSSAVIALVVTAVFSPGVLFARLFGGTEVDAGVQFKGSHILHYRSARLDTNEYRVEAEVWVPLLQGEHLWLWGILLIAAPLALFCVWQTRHQLSWLLLLYSGACFCVFFLFTTSHPVDIWRFFHSGTAALGFVTGLAIVWLPSAIRSVTPAVRGAFLLALAGAGILYVGGFVQYSLAVPWLADPRPPAAYRQDVEAVKAFLNREARVHERLLVLGNADHWFYPVLSSSQLERAALAGYVAAYSGQHMPTGGLFADRTGYSTDSPQLRRANAAQGRLSAVDLQALDITYLYASSPWLSDLHRAAMAEKLARGSLTRVWQEAEAGTPQSCRAFLRLDETARESVIAETFKDGERIAVPRVPVQLQLPPVRPANAANESSSTQQSKVQATVLITVNEPSSIVVASGDAFSMRIEVDAALAVRTPPIDADSVLTVRATSGSAQVLWLEVYAPLAPQAVFYLPDHLDLCGTAGVSAASAFGV